MGQAYLLLLEILYPADKCQIETNSETVLEEEGGSAAVELSFGDDGDTVTQQISFVHVMSGQDHCPACTKGQTSDSVLFKSSGSKWLIFMGRKSA